MIELIATYTDFDSNERKEVVMKSVMRKSGRYPWGTKPTNIVEVYVDCELCGKSHTEYAVDGHVVKPHFCEACWKKVVSEYLEEKDARDAGSGL